MKKRGSIGAQLAVMVFFLGSVAAVALAISHFKPVSEEQLRKEAAGMSQVAWTVQSLKYIEATEDRPETIVIGLKRLDSQAIDGVATSYELTVDKTNPDFPRYLETSLRSTMRFVPTKEPEYKNSTGT